MLLQSTALVAMKLLNELLVDDNITACVRQKCLVAVICNVSKRKTLSGGTFCSEKVKRNGSGLMIFSYCKDSAFTAFKKDSQL